MSEVLSHSMVLMRRAQGGDRGALDELFQRYYERVRPIVRARLGRRLRERIESGDIVQQVFITALKNFDKFQVDNEAKLIGWLARIVENQIKDELDKMGAAKRMAPGQKGPVSLDASTQTGSVLNEPKANDPRASEAAQRAERQAHLEECLSELSEKQRELIILRDYEGHSWEEIARQIEAASPDAARMQHATAKIELGKMLRRRSPDLGR